MSQRKRGICVEWDNAEQTIIRWDFYVWTWDDFRAAAQQSSDMRALMKHVPNLPSILNFQHSSSIPSGALAHARTAVPKMTADYTVLVGASAFARRLTQLFIELNPRIRGKVFIVDTLDDARKLINDRMD